MHISAQRHIAPMALLPAISMLSLGLGKLSFLIQGIPCTWCSNPDTIAVKPQIQQNGVFVFAVRR
jgi:hypothetical protein